MTGKRKLILGIVLAIAGIFLASQASAKCSVAHTLGYVKAWCFHLSSGDVTITLYADPSPHAFTVLSFDAMGTPSAKKAKLLGRVLPGLEPLGYKPKALNAISMALGATGYQSGVQKAVIDSGVWKSCLDMYSCIKAEKVVDGYLKSVDAFKEFDGVLKKYGLKRKSVSIDIEGFGCSMVKGQILCGGGVIWIELESPEQ